jgi:transposase
LRVFQTSAGSPVPEGLTIVRRSDTAQGELHLTVKPVQRSSACPGCARRSDRIHSHYERRPRDLPWHGRIVRMTLRVRRFRCGTPACTVRIFAERLPGVVASRAQRSVRLADSQRAIGLAAGGEPGSRLAHRLAMPVSGDSLLRMIRSAPVPDFIAPTIVGIDDWAWRRGQRYGTIICDLERNRVLDLLPDRNADSVAGWLRRYPGIQVVARDRAGLYADGARRGAPDAVQVADRWHLLRGLGDALREAVGRHRGAVSAAVKSMTGTQARLPPAAPGLARLRTGRKSARRERWEEICRLRAQGHPVSHIAGLTGISQRTVQRWLAAGGEPEHIRPSSSSHLLAPYEDWLESRWQAGCQVGQQLWRDLKEHGYRGSRNSIARWAARRRARDNLQTTAEQPTRTGWKAPSRRRCAWYLSRDPGQIDADARAFLHHLYAQAPELCTVAGLAAEFIALLDGNDVTRLDRWLEQAADSEVASFAAGIARDIDAVKGAITTRWTTSPVEGQINRVKAIKRQMYGRADYQLLRQRVLLAA